MFRPTNPHDWHQTQMEYQEWQRQRDTKKDDFPVIALNDQEFLLLKDCEKDIIPVTEQNRNAALRLRDLDFIKIMSQSEESSLECCFIRERGRNYLRYKEDEKSKERRANWHDWKIAIFSSFAGALLSRPIWGGIDWLINLFLK